MNETAVQAKNAATP